MGRHAGWRTQTPWTLPCPVVGLAQLTPSPEKQPQHLGRGAGQTGTQSPGMSQSQPERRRSPQGGPHGPMSPGALLLTCKGNRQAAPGSPSFLHSKQTRHRANPTRVEMVSPAFQQRGSEKARMWTESPGKPRSHPTTHPKSHTYSNNTPYCPRLKQKPNHKPDSRSRLRRTTCALQAAGLAPKPSLEDSCQ